ncbi:MAG: hypothetical protein M1818_004022 [Claussenomyces sp. TS43310]|nr:MAG: hypothetical protein M1818_004022 [Claussenomyces sp. TS43310]
MQGDAAGKREISEDSMSPDTNYKDTKKRRVTTSGSRGVANLTPEQLAKKRQNDREAQRAIRERTKSQIESLEKKIRDLTSQQPYQELQHALRQKEAVEAENIEIKQRLTSVLSLLQPLLGLQHNVEVQYVTSQPCLPPRPSSASHFSLQAPEKASSPPTVGASTQLDPPGSSFITDINAFANRLTQDQQRHELAHGLDMGPERLGLDFLLDGSQRINKIPFNMTGEQHSPLYQQPQIIPGAGSSRHQKSNTRGSATARREYEVSISNGEIPAHAAPIRNSAPTCPLDNILLDFLLERQQKAAEGVAIPKLVGPSYPSVSSLLNPAQSFYSHPLSKVFTDILGTFPDLSTLPEKLAILYIMFLLMRWQISPTQENYDRLPEWLTPRSSQLFTPHAAWIDHLPFPCMRDKLVSDYSSYQYLFDEFFIPFTSTLSLNWPYEPTDALLKAANSEELMINPVFERHLRRLENWSLGPAFADAFPGLANTFRLKMDGDCRQQDK